MGAHRHLGCTARRRYHDGRLGGVRIQQRLSIFGDAAFGHTHSHCPGARSPKKVAPLNSTNSAGPSKNTSQSPHCTPPPASCVCLICAFRHPGFGPHLMSRPLGPRRLCGVASPPAVFDPYASQTFPFWENLIEWISPATGWVIPGSAPTTRPHARHAAALAGRVIRSVVAPQTPPHGPCGSSFKNFIQIPSHPCIPLFEGLIAPYSNPRRCLRAIT